MEDITDASCMQAKRVCKNFEIKNLGEYHNLYVLGNTLLLANVFESFRNACLKIYEIDLERLLEPVPPFQYILNNYQFYKIKDTTYCLNGNKTFQYVP